MPVHKPSSRKNHCSYLNFRYRVGFRVNGGLLGYHTWLSPRRPRARKHPRDSGSSPDSGIFFAPARARVCGAFVFWVCARAVRVWGACGAFGVWFVCGGLGQGGRRVGRVAGWRREWRVVGLIFFCPKKVRPATSPRVPRGPGEITRAPRREGQPRRRVAACR